MKPWIVVKIGSEDSIMLVDAYEDEDGAAAEAERLNCSGAGSAETWWDYCNIERAFA